MRSLVLRYLTIFIGIWYQSATTGSRPLVHDRYLYGYIRGQAILVMLYHAAGLTLTMVGYMTPRCSCWLDVTSAAKDKTVYNIQSARLGEFAGGGRTGRPPAGARHSTPAHMVRKLIYRIRSDRRS